MKEIRVTRRKPSVDNDGELGLGNLLSNELDMLEAMLAGQCRVDCVEGRLVRRELTEPMPTPQADPLVGPHWKETGEPKEAWFVCPDKENKHASPSIMIQSLCGYYWTERKYAEACSMLESWGFVCLRSRRADNGQYWEIWYLPGLWAAKGDLRHQARSLSDKKGDLISDLDREALRKLGSWIFKRVPFGTMSCADQRLAMGVPE